MRQESKGIIERLDIAFMQILWHFLFPRLNAFSRLLQEVVSIIAPVIDDYRSHIKVSRRRLMTIVVILNFPENEKENNVLMHHEM